MSTSLLLQIGREILTTALLLSAPALLVSLVVGLAVSLFQAVTSIQEQTLSFVPRIVAVAVALIVTLPWSVRVLTTFTLRMLELAARATS